MNYYYSIVPEVKIFKQVELPLNLVCKSTLTTFKNSNNSKP